MFMEKTAEIKLVLIANDFCNLAYGVACGLKENLGIVDTQGYNILHRGLPGVLSEAADEPAYTHAP